MIGQKIKSRREELGLTQEELAKKLGYKSKSSINKIEMGKNDITQSKLMDFAIALECSPMFFIEQIKHPASSHDRIMKYAQLLASLDQAKRDNVMQYIDFISKKED